MPLNDYKCIDCGHKDTELQNYKDGELTPKITECPKCKSKQYNKLFPNSFSFDLIGPGFYINDHGKHNWKKGKSDTQISDVIGGDVDPY